MKKTKEFDHTQRLFWDAVGLDKEKYRTILSDISSHIGDSILADNKSNLMANSRIIESILQGTKGKKLTRKELITISFRTFESTFQALAKMQEKHGKGYSKSFNITNKF